MRGGVGGGYDYSRFIFSLIIPTFVSSAINSGPGTRLVLLSIFLLPLPPPLFEEKPKYVQSLSQVGPNLPSPLYLPLLPNGVLAFKQAATGLQACISLPAFAQPSSLSVLLAPQCSSCSKPCPSFSSTLPRHPATIIPTSLSLASPLAVRTIPPVL